MQPSDKGYETDMCLVYGQSGHFLICGRVYITSLSRTQVKSTFGTSLSDAFVYHNSVIKTYHKPVYQLSVPRNLYIRKVLSSCVNCVYCNGSRSKQRILPLPGCWEHLFMLLVLPEISYTFRVNEID